MGFSELLLDLLPQILKDCSTSSLSALSQVRKSLQRHLEQLLYTNGPENQTVNACSILQGGYLDFSPY